MENSAFQEHVTEAYDVLWRGVEWEAGEVEIPVFLRAPRSAPKLSCVGVSAGRQRSESWKGSRTNNTLNIVRFWAFPRLRGRSSRRRLVAEVSDPFQSTQGRPNALFLFASVSTQLQGRAGSLQQHVQEHNMRFKRAWSPFELHQNGGKRIETSTLLQAVRNGSETSGRSNDGLMIFRGVIEGFWNGEALRFGRPGQHKSSRWCEFRPEARERKRTSRLFPPPPRPPCKGDQTRFGDRFPKGRIFNSLEWTSSLRRAYP